MTNGLEKRFGTVVAASAVNISVKAGERVGLIGRKGAGKITTLRTVMGHLAPSRGSIRFDGKNLATLPTHARAEMGIGYMPEDRSLVPELTVEENILAPALGKRLAEVIAGLNGTAVSVLIAQSDLNHSRRLVDAEFVIEHGANVAPGVAAH